MSSTSRILLVACGSIDISASSRPMPVPSSATAMSRRPPAVTVTSIRVAPASRAFSISSLTTEAGRSTTSPAAILFATWMGSRRMCRVSAMRGQSGTKSTCPTRITSSLRPLACLIFSTGTLYSAAISDRVWPAWTLCS